ncbi:MAG: hypothetical protein HPY53_04485 [Brevinematales bacterium]|nr:hypothetical protein [Brevinematales bacterium]
MKMKCYLLVLPLLIFINGCALFHFFNPAVQNEVDYYAGLKGWVQMGQTFTNDIYMGAVFSFAFDSHEIPHLFFTTTSNNDTLFRYNGEWVVENQLTNADYRYKAVLRFKQDIPFVAVLDSMYTLGVYDYSSGYPHLMDTFIAGNVDYFDFSISPGGRMGVNFETNDGTSFYVNVKLWNGSAWVESSSFPQYQNAGTFDNVYFDFWGESAYSFMCFSSLTYVYNENSVFSINVSPIFTKIAGSSLFSVYSTMDGNVWYNIANMSSPGFSTNDAILLQTNSYLLMSHPTFTVTGTSPYKAYCLLSDYTGTNYSVAEINEDNTVTMLGEVPVHGTYNFGLYATPNGALYLVASQTLAGDESLQVFRYFE